MQNIKLAKEFRQQMQDETLCVESRPGVCRWWFPIQKATEIMCLSKQELAYEKLSVLLNITKSKTVSALRMAERKAIRTNWKFNDRMMS